MTTPNDGGPAFPADLDHPLTTSSGMSLRDWFAGQALVGVTALHGFSAGESIAADAYAIADAMLAARAGKASV